MEKRMVHRIALAICVLCSLLALLIATSSSPLYATNFWVDTNLYFTIGRGMNHGLMVYRDLFDHKGPLLFMLYALGAAVSETSFLGVFLLEILSMSATLYFAWKTVSLYGEGKLTLLAIPLSAMAATCCVAFNQGGSAEEFCLPALTAAIWCVFFRMRNGETCRKPEWLHIAFGAAMGWVFAIKFTDCGLFFGLAFAVLCYEWYMRGFANAFCSGLWMIAGMLLVVLPVSIYLIVNGIFDDTVQVYFVQNLFDYSGTPMSFTAHIYNALAYLRTQSAANPFVALPAMAGCGFAALDALLKRKKGFVFEMIAAPMAAGLLLLFCYWGEMAHPYYALVFAALVPWGLIPLGWLAPRMQGRLPVALCAAAMIAIHPVGRVFCQATPLMAVKKADMAQTVFTEIMKEEQNPTLLDLSSLDQGFYLASGILPNCRYFANNNLNTKEKRDALNSYLEEGRTMFVVSRWEDPGKNYELIAEHSSPFDLNDMRTFKLYRRID